MNKIIFFALTVFSIGIGCNSNKKFPNVDTSHPKEKDKSTQNDNIFYEALSDYDEIKIPVVFHVIIEKPDKADFRKRITDEMTDLHDDFLLLNSDVTQVVEAYKTRIGNPQVNFYLDESLGDKGVFWVEKSVTRNFYYHSPIVDPTTHLNVYIGNLRSSDGFVYSYSYLNKISDAVFLQQEWVGKDYRLLTHETGHWMGLWHVFEGGCANKENGDDISDTPPQEGPSSSYVSIKDGKRTYQKGCQDSVRMYNNFMDYSEDRRMFTKQQVIQMHMTLVNHRPKIWSTLKGRSDISSRP